MTRAGEERARVLRERRLGFLMREERLDEERISFRGLLKERAARENSMGFDFWA